MPSAIEDTIMGILQEDINLWENEGFDNWVTCWNDIEVRDIYNDSKENNPYAKLYAGYLEDSQSMYYDVSSAAAETGIDPNFLFQVPAFSPQAGS